MKVLAGLLTFCLIILGLPTDVSSDALGFIDYINSARSGEGLTPLVEYGPMNAAAASWASSLASRGVLEHSSDIVSGAPSDWTIVGENVGRGGSVADIFAAFMASPTHRANVMRPEYNLIGIGSVVTDSGAIYTVHRFAAGAAPTPTVAVPTPTIAPFPTAIPTVAPTQAPVLIPTPTPTFALDLPSATVYTAWVFLNKIVHRIWKAILSFL